MSKIALASIALVLAMVAGKASAATAFVPSQGTYGLNVALSKETLANEPVDFMLNGKYFIDKNTALTAGFGLNIIDTGAPSNSSYTAIGFKGGMRKYLKSEELAPFIGGNFQYISTRDTTGTVEISGFKIAAEAGAEYFLSKQFSVEGSVNFGYLSADLKPVGGGATATATGFGTTAANLSANFYF